MKRNITSFFALAALFATGLAMAAPQDAPQNAPAQESQQRHHGQAPDPDHQAKRLAKQLNLTSDQQRQLVPILANRDQQIAALRSNASLSTADRHSQMKSIRENADEQINGVLNDQQKQAYAQLKQQRRERSQQRREKNATPSAS